MADDQHRAAVGLQVIFQPFHCFQIEMVRRLVQNQQVGPLQQQTGQTQAGLLAAGEYPGRLCPCVGREPHAVQHLFDLGIHIVGIHRIHHSGAVRDLIGQLCIVGIGSQLLLQTFHLLHGIQRRGEHQLHRGIDIKRGVQSGILLQIAGGHAGAERRVPRIGQALAAQYAQERCLAGAVGADNADAVAALHPGCHIMQYLVFAEALA